ncbi:MAG TPA: tRNA-uridine aminocarboxypropyltransferase [Myxococcales bacterium]|nr:tRNA-uridine aminocarboxypropyltransferase [Myxococcales bacterium]
MRATCARCRRPRAACYCQDLSPVPTRTRVVFLQHPRERRVAIGTARLAHLALANSELHVGVDFQGVELSGDAALLFPSEGANDLARLSRPPSTLVVIDGTWPQAKKLLKLNPALQRLPRVGLRPRRPSNYRIRREPAEHCLSTVEAVAEVLSSLEGDEARFDPMLRAFDRMVDRQLEGRETRLGPRRTKRRRVRAARQWAPEASRHLDALVLVHGEANAPPFESVERFPPELVHLAALRPATGERLELVVAPRSPLGDSIPRYLELSREQLLAGLPAAEALRAWRAFAGEDAVLGAWGTFAVELLRALGDAPRTSIDLRQGTIRALRGQKPGGVERAASLLTGQAVTPAARGRCGRRMACLEMVLQGLLRTP